MPASPRERPSRAGSSVPCPVLPHPASAAATASAQAAAVVLAGRRMRARILVGALGAGPAGPRPAPPGVGAEAGGLLGLVPGHRHPRQRPLGRILEHEPQAFERRLAV